MQSRLSSCFSVRGKLLSCPLSCCSVSGTLLSCLSSRCVVSGTILSCLVSCFSVSGTLLSCLSSRCVVSGTILSCPLSCFSKTSENLIWLTGLKAPITKLFLFKYVIPFLSKGHFTTGVRSRGQYSGWYGYGRCSGWVWRCWRLFGV